MGELTDYLAHHIGLVVDNEQRAHNTVRAAVHAAIVTESPELTLSAYRAMSEAERLEAFAHVVGPAVLDTVCEWMAETLEETSGIGRTLIEEIMPVSGSADLEYKLAKDYMPEGTDADDFLSDDDADGPVIVTRDGKPISDVLPDSDAAMAWLLKYQPMSTDWAMAHEGYAIVPADSVPRA